MGLRRYHEEDQLFITESQVKKERKENIFKEIMAETFLTWEKIDIKPRKPRQ